MSSSKEKLKRVGVRAHTTGYKRRNSGASIYRNIHARLAMAAASLAV